jgi:hypothetical protein
MLEKLFLNLQLFGEGGDGGDGGSANPNGEGLGGNSGEDVPAFIPEKAKKYYQKAMAKENTKKPAPKSDDTVQTTDAPQTTEAKMSYADLIKSDDYKDEHKAYMDKTIGDRLKKYKGMEEGYNKSLSILEIVANKYGVSPDAENFLETLTEKIEADDSYYENYAMEHDISPEEARRIVTMERKVAQIEAEKAEAAKQEQMRQQLIVLHQNAEKTKQQFPQFDLNTEMQDEKFRRLCAVSNGDTTSAYMACHWKELTTSMVQMKTKEIQEQTAQVVANNKARPIENGLSSSSPSVVETNNFKGMSLTEIRAYADEQRRKGRK